MSRLLALFAFLVVFLPNAHSASLPIRWILRLLSDRLEIIDPRHDLSKTINLKTNVLQCRAGWGWGSWTGDRPGGDPPTSKNVKLSKFLNSDYLNWQKYLTTFHIPLYYNCVLFKGEARNRLRPRQRLFRLPGISPCYSMISLWWQKVSPKV